MTRYVCAKELATTMQLTVQSVKNTARRLKVPPTVKGHACHRWSAKDARKLLKRWEAQQKRKTHYGPTANP